MLKAHAVKAERGKISGRCRICGGATSLLLDLGVMPPANWLMHAKEDPVEQFPLVLEACDCGNFQLTDCLDAGTLYTTYSYTTPRSPSLTAHYARLIDHLAKGGHLSAETRVLEIGSNIGSFLEHIRPHVKSVLGVDPAQNIAKVANENGIPTIAEFFNREFAANHRELSGEADLVVARHCMAHNSDPYTILDGVTEILAPNGVLVIENAYAMATFENNEFDQIYHEHMFYFTVLAVARMLAGRGLKLVDVMTSEIHGGSIACMAKRDTAANAVSATVEQMIARERSLLSGGLAQRFADSAARIQSDLLALVRDLRSQGRSIYGYGATAKGATLLNSCGLTRDDIPYCADSTPTKQGRFVPKCGVEIVSEEWALANPPDVFLLTAWNYRDELVAKVRAAGLDRVQFIVPVPSVTIF
jgi:SAM-dependent methyltransferase